VPGAVHAPIYLRAGKSLKVKNVGIKREPAIAEKNRQNRRTNMKIKELRDGMKRVNVVAKVVEKSDPREVQSRSRDATYVIADTTISDETGTIKMTLWNEQIDQVNVNDAVKIENGYVTSFRGEIQLNVGRYGKLSVT